MTVHRDDIVAYTNHLVGLHDFKDYGPMGLQYVGCDAVDKIGAAVSISEEVIDKAAEKGVDLLFVHHGLFWNNEPRQFDKRMDKRFDCLERYNISVVAYHLCLDAHPDFGNNVLAMKGYEGTLRKFGDIGWGKKLTRPLKRDDVAEWEGTKYLYGPTQIRKIASIVGGAPHYIHEAAREGYDLFITGEVAEPTMALAKELEINFYAYGHYNSEIAGVRKLARIVEHEFAVEGVFIDIPNDV